MTFWLHWSTSQALQRFLQSASDTPESAVGFEFMQDNRIHVKHADGRYEQIPVFSLKAGLGRRGKNRPPIFWGKRRWQFWGRGRNSKTGFEHPCMWQHMDLYVRKQKKQIPASDSIRFTSGDMISKMILVVFYKSGL